MLTIAHSRRDFLRVGSLALGGLTIADMIRCQHAHGAGFVKKRSVVLLYLSGGASHIETFDPKMSAPEGTRSLTGEVSTSLPGVTFGGTFPELAKRADQLAVVRSFSHNVGDHVQAHSHVLSGGTDPTGMKTQGQSIGSMATRFRGTTAPGSGLPSYVALVEQEIDGQYTNEMRRFLEGSWPGKLGASYAPFQHEIGWSDSPGEKVSRRAAKKNRPFMNKSEGSLLQDMELSLPEEVLHDRRELLSQMDRLHALVDAGGTFESIDEFSSQAVKLLIGGAREAFDLTKEDPRLVKRYDTSHIRIGHKVFRPSTLGKQLLLARRLCEAGCGFVSISSAGWDMHADGNNPPIGRGMEMLGRSLDQAVSVFLDDLKDRRLSDDILLVITGDFGRTPKVNKNGGRDHWSKLGTLAFAGGGLKMGQVVGQSTRDAGSPATTPITPAHLLGTVMHTLFDVGKLRLDASLPAELVRLVNQSPPIGELV